MHSYFFIACVRLSTAFLGLSWDSMMKKLICYLLDRSSQECIICSCVKRQQRGLRQVHVGFSPKDRQRPSRDTS